MPNQQKKKTLLLILEILKRYSDPGHKMTQNQIADKLLEEGIELDRKAISNDITRLIELGFGIEKTRRGVYYVSEFDNSELHLLIDSVASNKMISKRYAKEIIRKLADQTSIHFKTHADNIMLLNGNREGDNEQLLLNVDTIHDAISMDRKISFDYYKYGEDKRLYKSSSHTVSPVTVVFHNMGYYLIGIVEYSGEHELRNYHIDHIKNTEVLDEGRVQLRNIKKMKNGMSANYFSGARPYMFTDMPERVTMIVNNSEGIINQIIDWFGKDITIRKYENEYDTLEISLMASPMAMKYWALQYATYVEIVEPLKLREEIIDTLILAQRNYGIGTYETFD